MSNIEPVILNLDRWKKWKYWIQEYVLSFYFEPKQNILNIRKHIEDTILMLKTLNVRVKNYFTKEEIAWLDFFEIYSSEEKELIGELLEALNKEDDEEVKRLSELLNKSEKYIQENIEEILGLHFKLTKLSIMVECFPNIEMTKKIFEKEFKELDEAYEDFMEKKEMGENFEETKSMFENVLEEINDKIENLARLV